MPDPSFHFSPTDYHRRIMRETRQELGYTGGDVTAWQNTLRPRLGDRLGLDLAAPRPPLNVQSLWQREHPLGTIEKIVFTSEEAADVSAFVCLPANQSAPYPFFICLQGHSTGMHNSIAVARDDNTQGIDHCMDNYVPGLLKLAEMADILGLFAPRPVVVVAGKEDKIFPIAATRAAFAKLREIYRAAGAEDHCHLVEGEGGHRFYADDAWPVMLHELQGAENGMGSSETAPR